MNKNKSPKNLKVAPSECIPFLQALSDENRWKMVQRLFRKSMSVSDIADAVGIQQPSASKHLATLREAGIVITRREGKEVLVSLNPTFRSQAGVEDDALDLGCCNFKFGTKCC